ncbi:putative zinc ribbon protein [Pantoea ananatis]
MRTAACSTTVTLPSDAATTVSKASWQCSQCTTDYNGECYCLNCRTGDFSDPTTVAA